MASSERKVQRENGAATQSKETRAKASATEKKKARTLEATVRKDEPLSPEVEARLSEIVAQVVSMHRRTTAQVFEKGECLAEAKSVQPEKRYGRWVKESCGYSVRSAWNFISVHERLGGHRMRLEKHAVGSTALFELAKAEPDQIEFVIKQYDDGKSLNVAEIKAIVSKKDLKAEGADPTRMGGKSGLQKMAAAKLKSDMVEFNRLAALVLVGLEDAIARVDAGKRIVMRSLANEVEIYARHASDLFKDIAAPLCPIDQSPRGNLYHATIERQTGWGAVQHSLYRLGGAGSWPARDEMEKWVVEVAHPALRFAVHGEPYSISLKPSDVNSIAVAEADGDVRDNDTPVPDKGADADGITPVMTFGEMDAALNSLLAETSVQATPSISR